MQIVDRIQFGPYSTQYHSAIVTNQFKLSLSTFLNTNLLNQLDEPACDANGKLTSTFTSDRYCGPNSLVRNLFSLEIELFGADGKSDLKADIEFHPETQTFSPRSGYGHHFYLWTPSRKRNRDFELKMIRVVVEDFRRTHDKELRCPICHGTLTGVDDSLTFDLRCTDHRCFVYNYHKDEDGRLAHGHFFTKHPETRA
jgi:hypothetical protein